MKVYKVGGCVRDKLLNIDSYDNDYVVIGATVDEMLELGFIPVGKFFPVFLHPTTKEEYALARKEKKNGVGHKQFVFYTDPGITLKEDLYRRDITINALAEDNAGNIIDYNNGIADLKNKCIRHVSYNFIEDPLRVIRCARFAAVLEFTIVPETLDLMKSVTDITSLSRERLTNELIKLLYKSNNIIRFVNILHQVNTLDNTFSDFIILLQHKDFIEKVFRIIVDNFPQQLTNYKLVVIYYIICSHNNNCNFIHIKNKYNKNLCRYLLELSSYQDYYNNRQWDKLLNIVLSLRSTSMYYNDLLNLSSILFIDINMLNKILLNIARINFILKQIDYTTVSNIKEHKVNIIFDFYTGSTPLQARLSEG